LRELKIIKIFLSVFLLALVVLSAITMLEQVPDYSYDQYFALYTLGASRTAEHYFPDDIVDIFPGIRMSWFVSVYNHMGALELVKVVFKMLNSTMGGPDQLRNSPSERSSFYEETRLLLSNETWTLPITWSVLNATGNVNATAIHSVRLNNEVLTRNVETEAAHGYNFRVVIELWVYDEVVQNFSFVWESGETERSAWNQLWFNMTRVGPLP
jgi:hypothetical protein